jgi:hypothetical protein
LGGYAGNYACIVCNNFRKHQPAEGTFHGYIGSGIPGDRDYEYMVISTAASIISLTIIECKTVVEVSDVKNKLIDLPNVLLESKTFGKLFWMAAIIQFFSLSRLD